MNRKEVIRLHPDNPKYMQYEGKPTVLVTAGEHYGAVINLDYNYTPYLDMLQEFNLNLTRVFSGAYLENEQFIDWMKLSNTLAPRPMRFLTPWKRSTETGYANGGNKFDLDQWDETYFERLKDFIGQADSRGIVVEYVFFSQMYNEAMWNLSPMNFSNNINSVGTCTWDRFTTQSDEALIKYQESLARKIVTELNQYDNVYYEICNEPNSNALEEAGVLWHNRLIEVVLSVEAELHKKHMIAVDYDNPYMIRHIHPAVSITNTHYTWGDGWVGAMSLLENFYDQPRVLALDETIGFPIHLSATEGRLEAWEALVGGCAVYNHLSWAYTPDDPAGETNANRAFLSQLRTLKKFMESFDLPKMSADRGVLAKGVYEDAHFRALVEEGRQYAIYVHHGKRNRKSADTGYEAVEGEHELQLGLWIPKGKYTVEWVLPETGAVLEKKAVEHSCGIMKLNSPVYSIDIALKIMFLLQA